MGRFAVFAAAALLSAGHVHAQPANSVMGQVNFANSGAPAAQQAFHRGLALLHNFQYPAAVQSFQAAQQADPGFAMAYWGEAMAQNYSVWMEQHPEKARAALAKLGANPAARLAKAKTERERGFLEAVEALYGQGTKEQRDFAYSAKMEQLYRAYPKDVDVASFYALSLLGLAHKGRDYGLYMRAAAVLEPFFPTFQRHPGVVHYLIHSYDDPVHAPLGLRAARLYGAIAPDSHHAQHMTSHIFIALPDWAATIEANRKAMEMVNRDRAAEGRGPGACGHYLEWMHYAYFQIDQAQSAAPILAACRTKAEAELAGIKEPGRVRPTHSYAAMRAQTIVETGVAPTPALSVDPSRFAGQDFDLAYGDLLLARGKAAQVAAAHARLKSAAARTPFAGAHPLATKRQQIILAQAEGLEALAAGRRDEGLAALKKAAEMERTMEVPFGPPIVEKPSFELLGDELTAVGRLAEAADAYAAALKLAPGRKRSLAGYALASKAQPGSLSTAAAGSHTH